MIAIKDGETDKPIFKERLVAYGCRDSEKHNLVHGSIYDCQSSVRLLIALAAIMVFDVRTEDISQAYLVSASKLLRKVYLRPYKHLQAPAGYKLKFLRLLYGLVGSGDYRHATFAKHLRKNLSMQTVASDLSCFLDGREVS